jgi:hypothetical protein
MMSDVLLEPAEKRHFFLPWVECNPKLLLVTCSGHHMGRLTWNEAHPEEGRTER